jgi:hypothetical protein
MERHGSRTKYEQEHWRGVREAEAKRGLGMDYVTCPECGRLFDLMNMDDNSEWYYGHDCEEER